MDYTGLGRYVMVIDHEFVWQGMTTEYARLLGWRKQDLVGRSAWEASLRGEQERISLAHELDRTGQLVGESTVVTRHGEWVPWAHRTWELNAGLYVSVGEPIVPASSGNFSRWTRTGADGVGYKRSSERTAALRPAPAPND